MHLHKDVIAAIEKLQQTQNPDELTLEEIMMCCYKLPCRRVTPGSNQNFKRYGRGSILFYAYEIILILMPEDNTVFFQYKRPRYIAPRRRFGGVLPGSVFYTQERVMMCVKHAFLEVQSAREKFRTEDRKSETEVFAWQNPPSAVQEQRCIEAFVLASQITIKRFKGLPKPTGEYEDISRWITDHLE